MATKPHISIRKSIKWGDEPAGENTDTLVLTSAQKSYVDIRIYLPTLPSEPVLPTNPSDPLAIKRLEWAFAGSSQSTPASFSPDGQLLKPAHSVWSHWVDSKTLEEVSDEGYMYPIPGSNEVLEKGRMANPATGKLTDYEEVWIDLDIVKVGTKEKFVSWVLTVEGSDPLLRGMAMRIGEWIQAILRVGDIVSISRWKWKNGTGFERILTLGQLELSADVFGERDLTVGQTFTVGDGMQWKCTESHNWT